VFISYIRHCTKGDGFVKSKLAKAPPPLGDQVLAGHAIDPRRYN
jgi:hypothetical protein